MCWQVIIKLQEFTELTVNTTRHYFVDFSENYKIVCDKVSLILLTLCVTHRSRTLILIVHIGTNSHCESLLYFISRYSE